MATVSMRRGALLGLAAFGVAALVVVRRSSLEDHIPRKLGPQPDGSILVPTNQLLTPAGFQLQFPGRPTDLALSPDGSLLAVKNQLDILPVRMQDRALLQTLTMARGGQGFVGILFSADGKRIFATDSEERIQVARLDGANVMHWEAPIPLPGPARTAKPSTDGLAPTAARKNPSSPGGMALDAPHGALWVTLSRNNAVGIVDLESGRLTQVLVGRAPFTVVLGPRNRAYVSNWAGRAPRPGEPTARSSGSDVLVDPKTGVASSGTLSIVDVERRVEL